MSYDSLEIKMANKDVYVVLYQWYDTTEVVAIANTQEVAQQILDKAIAKNPSNAYFHIEKNKLYL